MLKYYQIPSPKTPFTCLSIFYTIISILSMLQYICVVGLSYMVLNAMGWSKYRPICELFLVWAVISQLVAIVISCAYGRFNLCGKIYYIVFYVVQLVAHYLAYEPMYEVWEKISRDNILSFILALVLTILWLNGFMLAVSAAVFVAYLFVPSERTLNVPYHPLYVKPNAITLYQ